jgi:transposase, IS30 family
MSICVTPQMTVERRKMVFSLRGNGLSVAEVARAADIHLQTAYRVLDRSFVRDEGRPETWSPAPGRLSLADREEITVGLARGERFTPIAARLGRSVSTISREVAANGGRADYRAWAGQRRAQERSRRPKLTKLGACPKLRDQVSRWLSEWWSPEEIAARLRQEFPDDPMMRVSHETIYQSLFVQGRGELRRELTRCLRSGRTARRPQGHKGRGGNPIPGMVMLSERPQEADDRAVPGHWEGDLILGAGGRSAVGTLVERTTRYVLLLHLPKDRTATTVAAVMAKAIRTLPDELVRSITWDQGKEMCQHKSFTVATGVPIYFCDPHSPWQRGSNENTNGLLRQYMPKGTDLSKLTAADLARFQRSLNGRPRKTLGFMKPSEKLAELLALTP